RRRIRPRCDRHGPSRLGRVSRPSSRTLSRPRHLRRTRAPAARRMTERDRDVAWFARAFASQTFGANALVRQHPLAQSLGYRHRLLGIKVEPDHNAVTRGDKFRFAGPADDLGEPEARAPDPRGAGINVEIARPQQLAQKGATLIGKNHAFPLGLKIAPDHVA